VCWPRGRSETARSLLPAIVRLELFLRKRENGAEGWWIGPAEQLQLVTEGEAAIGEAPFRELFPHEGGHGSPGGRLDLRQSVELDLSQSEPVGE
jgi:hypothetical protein